MPCAFSTHVRVERGREKVAKMERGSNRSNGCGGGKNGQDKSMRG